ncbi:MULTISPECIES: DUF3592 domain-containing protein [unclassified Paraburkholderia]|uniref:DUF3592 domain-containing protein n=1 Tax=unclassified Paraburkholderia TaxID=2615204 RepID=UPI002AB20A13|nr:MULTISPECIES: DUF3592 domain-containing protein [unclassified Paraburkholderia]
MDVRNFIMTHSSHFILTSILTWDNVGENDGAFQLQERSVVSKTLKFNYGALVIGLCIAIWTLFSLSGQIAFVKSSVVTQGKVVRLNYGEHHPQILFVTQTGERISIPGSFVSAEVGDSVRVRYDPDNPRASAVIDSFSNLWLETLISSVFMIAFLYAGLTGQEFRPRYG